jgi:hypothetical protein
MTLPFRRRHHDSEGSHDRARSLVSRVMVEPIDDDEQAWLDRHLGSCTECRRDRDGFLADRELLQSLRDRAPEPPRDLWAKTSAALDLESRARGRRDPVAGRGAGGRSSRRWRGMPVGAAAGVLIALVVLGTAVIPGPQTPDATARGSLPVGVASTVPEPTNINIRANNVAWIQPDVDGNWKLYISDVDEVCPRSKPGCNSLGANQLGRPVDLGGDPTGVTISPSQKHLLVHAGGDGSEPSRIFVVPVPVTGDLPTQVPPTDPVETPTEPSTTPSTEPSVVVVSPSPTDPTATPGSTPTGGIEIASGVTIVGEAAYSPGDGDWLAFSARPSDNSTGPDLYLWRVGDPAAVPVTSDHRTYFSGWHEGRVLASRVLPPTAGPGPSKTGEPGVTTAPAASEPGASASTSAQTTTGASASLAAQPTGKLTPDTTHGSQPSGMPRSRDPVTSGEAQTVSFLLDPATGITTDLARPNVWLPVVDPSGRFAAYWSGTVVATEDGLGWQLGTGQLVLDGWSDVVAGEPGAGATSEPATAGPETSTPPASAPPVVGPVGNELPLVAGEITSFQAKFDPEGERLAVWVGEDEGDVGRLHLRVIDPSTGTIDEEIAPLPGTPALRRFSMDTGRLAWVNPRGQDGQESTVQVLGWSEDDFGEIRTIPARDLFIVR